MYIMYNIMYIMYIMHIIYYSLYIIYMYAVYICILVRPISIFLITNPHISQEMAGNESTESASLLQFMHPGERWWCHGQHDNF